MYWTIHSLKRWVKLRQVLKTISLVFLSVTVLLSGTSLAYAHPTAREHNIELEKVLFEDGYSKYQSDKIKKYVTAIEYASYLTIDQFGGNGENDYNTLKKWKMGGLPLKFSSIDYSEDLQGNGRQINANTHRRYTHQGWDREYETASVKKFWKARRNVLLGTINTIFDFGHFSSVIGYDEKCNSLSGIIYYVHILGDYEEADNYRKISMLQDLAGHENTDKNDMISSLKQYAEILFEKDQKSSVEYKALQRGLDDLSSKAGRIVQSVGGVNTDEEFEEYHQYAEDLLQLLMDNMPALLKREDFFKKVFYLNL